MSNSNANDTISEESDTSEHLQSRKTSAFSDVLDIPPMFNDRKSSFPQFLNDKSRLNQSKSTNSHTTLSYAMEVDFEINDFFVHPLKRSDALISDETDNFFNF